MISCLCWREYRVKSSIFSGSSVTELSSGAILSAGTAVSDGGFSSEAERPVQLLTELQNLSYVIYSVIRIGPLAPEISAVMKLLGLLTVNIVKNKIITGDLYDKLYFI